MAFQRLCYDIAEEAPKTRFTTGLDSNVALSAILKGRSPSFGLRPTLRKIGATVLAGCLYPALHFFLTRYNGADHPTRDMPEPCSHSLRPKSCQELYQLAKVSSLRRFAANWARLVLLVLCPPCPWWSSSDSWRFAHYHHSAYPYRWASRFPSPDPGDSHCCLGFGWALGFPGEGPVAWIFSILSISSPCSLFGLISWTLPAACYAWTCPAGLVGLPQNSKVVLLSFWRVGSPSLVLAVGPEPSHGRLDPRSRGDVERANRRKSLPLDLSWKRLARRERSC